MSAVFEAKRALRAQMRARLAQLEPVEREAASAAIRRRLESPPESSPPEAVLGFLALPSEPDLWLTMQAWSAAGITVCLPRWRAATEDYEAARVEVGVPLRAGPYGVLEPPPEAPAVAMERLDLILVPGLAFDPSGRRLGRGKGFFDRLLSFAGRARRWGVAFDFQVVAEVPAEPHDVNVQLLVTPGAWRPVGSCERP